jgi:hypothetical protein
MPSSIPTTDRDVPIFPTLALDDWGEFRRRLVEETKIHAEDDFAQIEKTYKSYEGPLVLRYLYNHGHPDQLTVTGREKGSEISTVADVWTRNEKKTWVGPQKHRGGAYESGIPLEGSQRIKQGDSSVSNSATEADTVAQDTGHAIKESGNSAEVESV